MKDKYYVELFTLNNVLIYGYAAATDIAESDWNMKRIKVKNKINIVKYSAVINEEEFDILKKDLQEDALNIMKTQIESGLNKDELVSKINTILDSEQAEENIETIDSKLEEEIWFAFDRNIEKLGSFEICNELNEKTFFESVRDDDHSANESIETEEEVKDNSKEFMENMQDEQEIIELYKDVKKLNNKKLAVFEEIINKEDIRNFKNIIEDNKEEICRFFIEECSKGNLEAFRAVSLLMYMSRSFNDEVIEKFAQYDLSLDSIRNYLQIVLGNDNVSERTETYSVLKEKLEKCCNRNPITAQDFEWTKSMFNHPIKSCEVDNKFVLGFLQLLRKRSPEKLIDLVIDVKGPLVYTELMVYLHENWNEAIFTDLLNRNITTFKELAFVYAYSNIKKNNSHKEDKIKGINEMMSMMSSADKSEFAAFIVGMISDEDSSEESDEIKNNILAELVVSLDEKSNMKRILLLLNSNDDKKTICNLHEIGEKITFDNINLQINKEIISLVKVLFTDKFKGIDDIKEIDKILFITAHSKLALKNNTLTIRDLKEELIINNYRVLGNPYLRKINYNKWHETLNKFIINIIYKAHLLNQYDGRDKAALVNTIIDEFYVASIGLRQAEDEVSLSAFKLIISIFAEWVKAGYIDLEIKNKIYSISPAWV